MDEFGGQAVVFAEDVRVSGEYCFDGESVLVEGEGELALSRVCARCAEPFVKRMTVPFSERFVREGTLAMDDECRALAGNRLQLLPVFMENLYLRLPIVATCRTDCKGLCPRCGVNLNQEDCPCGNSSRGNAFSALSELYKDNKEV